jgi:N-acetylglucosamine malate deacetylase 2
MTEVARELYFLREGTAPAPRVVIISPHPDDEVIGAGTRLPLLTGATVVQVTNGAPPEMTDARAAGYSTREAYAAARRHELHQALSLCGVYQTIELGLPDQRAAFQLAELTRTIRKVLERTGPDYVVTVPYEGGHPDHDATAFAVHQACAGLPDRPRIIEMLSYHNANGCCEMECFLEESREVLAISLTAEEIQLKQRLFQCFMTQQKVLRWFPLRLEKFRFAPRYDFTRPPHPGQLYYELFAWGLNARRWCELAKHALAVPDLLPA